MKQIFLSIMILCVGLSVTMRNGTADENEKQKLALEAFKVMNLEQMMSQTSQAIAPQLIAAIKKKNPDLDASIAEKIVSITLEEFNRLTPELMLFSGQSMVKYYNEDDLRNVIAFYKSETGQKALKFLPQMMVEMNRWMIPKANRIMEVIKDRLGKELEIQM